MKQHSHHLFTFSAFLFSLFIGLGGCTTTRQIVTSTPFDTRAAAYIHHKGTLRIEGQAFVIDPATGRTRYAAGEVVRLVPATKYARERFAQIYGRSKILFVNVFTPVPAVDPLYASYTRMTKADARGHFQFDNLVPGAYFVTTLVPWLGYRRTSHTHTIFDNESASIYEYIEISPSTPHPTQVIVSGS